MSSKSPLSPSLLCSWYELIAAPPFDAGGPHVTKTAEGPSAVHSRGSGFSGTVASVVKDSSSLHSDQPMTFAACCYRRGSWKSPVEYFLGCELLQQPKNSQWRLHKLIDMVPLQSSQSCSAACIWQIPSLILCQVSTTYVMDRLVYDCMFCCQRLTWTRALYSLPGTSRAALYLISSPV